jgi:hypothetical protein
MGMRWERIVRLDCDDVCHRAISEPGSRELVDSSGGCNMLFESDTDAQRPIQWMLWREVIVQFHHGRPAWEREQWGMIAGSHVQVPG